MNSFKLIISFLFIISYFEIIGQIATIKDKDGYTNVRVDSSINSSIIYKMKESEVFFIDHEYLDLSSKWILIWFDDSNNQPKKNNPTQKRGFVHRSRIQKIENLPIYEGQDVELNFLITRADTLRELKHNVIYYGLEIPLSMSYEIKSLTLNWYGRKIIQDKSYYCNLFNVFFEEGRFSSNREEIKTYMENDTFYIEQSAGDGAGFYYVVWVIKDGKILQRLVGSTI